MTGSTKIPSQIFATHLLLLGIFVEAGSAVPTSDEIGDGIAAAHSRLLHHPDGFTLEFTLDVEQPNDIRTVAFPKGSGTIRCKWPRIYCRFEAPDTRIGGGRVEHMVREGNYNFDTKISAALDGLVVAQLTPMRHVWSSDYLYPLRLRYVAESSQDFFLGKELKTNYWMPNALKQNPSAYSVSVDESTFDEGCYVLDLLGRDKVWVSPERGFAILRRQLRVGGGDILKEEVENSKFVEVAKGIWMPMQQTKTVFDESDGRLLYRLKVFTSGIVFGGLSDNDFNIEIPDQVQSVQDFIRGSHYIKANAAKDPFKFALNQGRRLVESQPSQESVGLGVLINVALILGVLIVMQWRRIKT